MILAGLFIKPFGFINKLPSRFKAKPHVTAEQGCSRDVSVRTKQNPIILDQPLVLLIDTLVGTLGGPSHPSWVERESDYRHNNNWLGKVL